LTIVFKILKEINYNQLFYDFKYTEYKYYNACLLVAIKKNDKRFLKYRKDEKTLIITIIKYWI
jgi:hypothetical protein